MSALAVAPDQRSIVSVTPRLSRREHEVLSLVADGCDTGEIARALDLAEDTVKKHVLRITGRLGARNRAHAVGIALRAGLIS